MLVIFGNVYHIHDYIIYTEIEIGVLANDFLRRKLSSICMWSSYCQSLKHQRATPRKVLINILQAQQTLSSPYLVMGDFNNSNVTDAFSNMKLSL